MYTHTHLKNTLVQLKSKLLLVLILSCCLTISKGQTVQQIIIGPTAGTGTYSYGPLYRNTGNAGLLNYSRHAYIYTSTELNIPSGSKIISLEWLKKDTARVLGSNTFNVWMNNTPSTSFAGSTAWSTLITGATQVFGSTAFSVTGIANAYVSAPFIDSFVYNGGSLQIMTDWAKLGYATAAIPFYVVGATGKAIGYASSSALTGSSLLQSANYGNSRPTLRITYVTVPSCVGTPAPGNTLANVSSICTGISFTLSLQNTTPGGQVTFQWQSADNLAFTTNLTTNLGTNSTLTTSQTSNKYYRCLVTCGAGPATGISTPIYMPMSASYSCYCSSTAQSNADEDIYKFSFGSLKNCSDCSSLANGQYSTVNLYSNYQYIQPPTVLIGSVVPFSIEIGVCGTGNYPNRCAIFIDYNHNNSFIDPGEQVYSSATSMNGAHTESGTILIPSSAMTGLTGLRVINAEQGYVISNPCLVYPWGETEDYVINIGAASVCSGAPIPGNTVINVPGSCTTISTTYSLCSGKSIDLSIQNLTSGTGVTYQWYNNGVAISGATLPVYTTPALTTPQVYYCNVTCTSSGLSTASTAINIVMESYLNCYCSSGANNPADEDILSFSLNGLTSTSDCTIPATGVGSVINQYSNFSPLGNLTTLTLGSTVPFSIMVDDCDVPPPPYYSFGSAIWIDFNHNGSFNDAGEQVFVEATSALSPRVISGNIAIPCTALTGQTKVRITAAEGLSGASLVPCLSYGFGETEDYLINIAQPTAPCSNPIPSPGNTQSNVATLCDSTNVILSLQNKCLLGNYTYQWFKNSVAIPGATNYTYTTPKIFAITTYYCTVSCGASSISSLPLTIQKTTITNVTLTASSSNYCPGSTGIVLTSSSSSALTYTYSPNGSLIPTTGNIVSASPTTATTYTVTGTDANGCSRTSSVALQIISCSQSLSLKLYIQSYYIGSGLMTPSLVNQLVGTNSAIADSIDVQLRQSTSPYAIAFTKRVALNTNGTTALSLPASLTGSYYIVVKQRNSIETWSATAVSTTIGNYDFTTAANKAYGNNMILVDVGKWAFYSGDVNTDNNIDLLDMNLIGNDVINFASGYQTSDINGDGNVDLIDTFPVEVNIANFVFTLRP